MTTWTSFAMRPNTDSAEGQVPIAGDPCTSPDIIPMSTAVQNPQATFSSPDSWTNDYPAQVNFGAANYLYVRAKNFGTGAETATVSMYAAGNGLINLPQQWLSNPLQVQTGGTTVSLSAQTNQQIVVGGEPFYWQAPPPPAGSDHYCLFALVDDPANPNPLLHGNVPDDYNTMADLVNNNLYVGWKNVAEVGNPPTWTEQMQMPIPPNAQPNQLLHVYVFGTAGYVGSQVEVTSGDGVSFNPPITIQQTTITSPTQTYGTLTTPQAGTSGTTLNVSCWTGSGNPGFRDRIVAVCGWVPNNAEELQPFLDSGAARRLPTELLGDTPVEWEVPIGAMHYQVAINS
jgi:hypothetical protein